MADKYRVTMDTSVETLFLVHLPHKIVKFHQLNNRRYGMHPDENKNNKMFNENNKVQLLNSIKENLQFLSPRQQDARGFKGNGSN